MAPPNVEKTVDPASKPAAKASVGVAPPPTTAKATQDTAPPPGAVAASQPPTPAAVQPSTEAKGKGRRRHKKK